MSALPRAARPHAAFAGLAYAVHFGAWVASLGLVTVVVSTTLVTTTPLMLAALALVTRRDPPGARTLVGLALGTIGVVLLGLASPPTAPGAATTWPGVALALLGAAAMAAYLLIARRLTGNVASREPPPSFAASLAFAGLAALVGGALLLATAALAGAPLLPATSDEALILIGAAALPQLVGHTILTWAVTRTSPTTVALVTLGEPVGAALLAALLLAEPLTPLGGLAALVTLAAVALALSRPPVLDGDAEP